MRIILIIIGIIVTFITVVVLAFTLSPRPSAWLVHYLFKEGPAVKPDNYEEYEQLVEAKYNLTYPSTFKDATLDIFSPVDTTKTYPTIIWVHGGAYVGGSKADIESYGVMLASQGFHVVSVNYELAPSAQYPSPLLQLNDVYQFVKDQSGIFKFDLDRLYFAGDSAGAQIVSQYALIQSDEGYAKQVGIKQAIPNRSIKGVLLYCGPFDISKLAHLSDNKYVAFLLGRVGWAYIGEKDWVHSEQAKLASTKDFVTANYPPTFITDGNVMTFTQHGIELAQTLADLNVPVTTKFYPVSQAELPHEYQFIFTYPEAQETFEATIQFLKETSN